MSFNSGWSDYAPAPPPSTVAARAWGGGPGGIARELGCTSPAASTL
jgi:hypothetical protein